MKRLLVLIAAVLAMAALFGCSTSSGSSSGQSSGGSAAEDELVTSDEFVTDVLDSIANCVGEGEEIEDVAMSSNTLTVFVNLGEMDESADSAGEVAVSRASSITDEVLKLDRYDDLWQAITVDFGAFGHITCDKADVRSGDGGRHFDSADMVLEKD